MLAVTTVMAGTNAGVAAAIDHTNGLHDRFATLPMPHGLPGLARTINETVFAVARAAILLAGAALLGFRFHGGVFDAAAGLVVLVVLAGAMSALFGRIGDRLRRPDVVQFAGMMVMMPFMFISGAFAPLDTMPGWMRSPRRPQPGRPRRRRPARQRARHRPPRRHPRRPRGRRRAVDRRHRTATAQPATGHGGPRLPVNGTRFVPEPNELHFRRHAPVSAEPRPGSGSSPPAPTLTKAPADPMSTVSTASTVSQLARGGDGSAVPLPVRSRTAWRRSRTRPAQSGGSWPRHRSRRDRRCSIAAGGP